MRNLFGSWFTDRMCDQTILLTTLKGAALLNSYIVELQQVLLHVQLHAHKKWTRLKNFFLSIVVSVSSGERKAQPHSSHRSKINSAIVDRKLFILMDFFSSFALNSNSELRASRWKMELHYDHNYFAAICESKKCAALNEHV